MCKNGGCDNESMARVSMCLNVRFLSPVSLSLSLPWLALNTGNTQEQERESGVQKFSQVTKERSLVRIALHSLRVSEDEARARKRRKRTRHETRRRERASYMAHHARLVLASNRLVNSK